MEEHVLGITRVVNHLFGPLAGPLLTKLHIQPANPELPIPQHVVMGMVAVLIGTIFALLVRSRLSVEKPGALQQIAEGLLTNPLGFGIRDLLVENVGHSRRTVCAVCRRDFCFYSDFEFDGSFSVLYCAHRYGNRAASLRSSDVPVL